MRRAENIFEKASAYGITTVNQQGFPKTLILPSIMNSSGIATQYIYLNRDSETVQNALVNYKGSIACYAELGKGYFSVLNLKGIFSVVDIDETDLVSTEYRRHDELLRYDNPCVLVFETLSFDVEKTVKIDLDRLI
ncbi:hypothetical protein [Enterococcus sp. AZ189]|uniref:hypothetical protein n=1 Tax=Enterococcus sp. AZ189 TaxID=2774871 RepID=UPI003F201EED